MFLINYFTNNNESSMSQQVQAQGNKKQIIELEKNTIWVVKNVLTPEQCQKYIEFSEKQGYEKAGITVGENQYVMMEDVRNNTRVIYDDKQWAEELFQLVKDYLPCSTAVLPRCASSMKNFDLVGLNERWRFYKYDAGQTFKPHYDGCFARPNVYDNDTVQEERSFLTLIFYLNNVTTGGETKFYEEAFKAGIKTKHIVQPKCGDILVFSHNILHEGAPIPDDSKETKYVLRTDVMFRRVSKKAAK